MITLRFDFRIKPYVRMTQRGMYVKPEALEYRACQKVMQMVVNAQMGANGWDMLPGQIPLRVTIRQEFEKAMHNHDGDNVEKAILDAMNGIVYPDDRWVDELRRSRVKGKSDMTVVTIERMEG